MGVIPGGVDTAQQPPMTVPLRHFLVGFAFLLAGMIFGFGAVTAAVPGPGSLVHVHFLLAGWICVTIMGAMTQFVPVWSGVTLHSRRLANLQLGLVSFGLLGFAATLSALRIEWAVVFGALMLAGFWTFVYNIVRTLASVDRLDVTERHFLLALAFFVLLTTLGFLLALDFRLPVAPHLSVSHAGLVHAHVTVAVFGAVLTTVYGALYQLATMFTQTELHGIDHGLRRVEAFGHPVGVVLLAGGRLFESVAVARVGGLFVSFAALAFGVILARKLYEMQLEVTPMHTRYAVVTASLLLWATLSIPAWIAEPTARSHLLGAAGTTHLLMLGVLGFVVFGTLYHVVPFIIWVHRYSELLGLEAVPMIDDLYDDRLAALDGALLLGGTVALVSSDRFALGGSIAAIGGVLVFLGVAVFIANMLSVLRRHGPHSIDHVLLGTLSPRRLLATAEETSGEDVR